MRSFKQLRATAPGITRILRKFSPQIRKQKPLLVVSFLALLVETVFRLLEPWPLKFIFDNVLLPRIQAKPIAIPVLAGLDPLMLLTVLAVSIVALAGLRGAAAYSSTTGMVIAATHISAEVRGRLYSHFQALSLSFHHQAQSGDLITRVTYDIDRLREVTVVAALPLSTNILTLVGMVAVMFWLNWELALISIAILPLFVVSTVRMSKKIQKISRSNRKREGMMAAVAAEAIGAIKVVQAFSLEGMLKRNFDQENQERVMFQICC
jgi:ATP-binding cassette subfamily B protein